MGEDYRPSRRRISLSRNSSPCAVEQFYSDASMEKMKRWAPTNSKNWQWTTEGDVSVRRSTPVPHGGVWQYSFLQAVGSTLVYCYRCTNVGFVNSFTSAAPWTARKPLHRIILWQTIDVCVGNGLMNTEVSKLIDLMLPFQMNRASICGTTMAVFVLDVMLVNAAFTSALSNNIVGDY